MKKIFLLLSSIFVLVCTDSIAQSSRSSTDDFINSIKDRIKLSGYAQAGSTSVFSNVENEDDQHSFLVRRVELSLKAKINDQWSFAYTGDFNKGHRMKDFYVEYRIMPELGFRVGQYKTAFSLENNISNSVNEVLTGGAQITRYLAASDASDILIGNQWGRDVGIEVRGDLFDRLFSYRLGLLNGQGASKLDLNAAKTMDASVLFRPVGNLSIMASALVGRNVAQEGIATVIEKGAEYKRNRWGLGVNFKSDFADFHTEYLSGRDASIYTSGYYLTGAWHIIPKLDLVLSYDFFKQNWKDNGNEYEYTPIAHNYTGGLQYWFYPKCRLQVQYANWDGLSMLNAQVQVGF